MPGVERQRGGNDVRHERRAAGAVVLGHTRPEPQILGHAEPGQHVVGQTHEQPIDISQRELGVDQGAQTRLGG